MKKKYLSLCGMLAMAFCASNSQAAIVFTDIADVTLATGATVGIDFDNSGTSEIDIQDMGFGGTVVPGSIFQTGASMVTVSSAEWDVLKGLATNVNIGPSTSWFSAGDAYVNPGWETTHFPSGSDVYLGAKFAISTNTYYGWICVNLTANGDFIIKSYAYNNTPGTAIMTGDKGGSGATDIDERMEKPSVKIGPNPVSDYLQVQPSKAGSLQIAIIAGDGKVVYTQSIEAATSINLQTLPSGIYWLNVSAPGQGTSSETFVKE